MTSTDEQIKTVIGKLVKVAEDMAAVNQDAAEQKAGPDEVAEALSVIIGELETVVNAIPTQEAPEGDVAPEAVAPEESPKVAELTTKVAELTDKLDAKEREDIAEDFADLFDPLTHDAKVKEVIVSKDSNETWTTKIAAIRDFQEQNPKTKPYRHAQSYSGYVKTAQRDDRMLYL